MKEIVIANCGGFWGDDPTALRRQVRGGPVDYLVTDYLAEVTMAVLNKQRARDPQRGYAADFVTHLRDSLPEIVERGVKVISNAGGVNPEAAGEAVEKAAAEAGLADRVRVGVVTGDDLLPRLDEILAAGEKLEHLDTGRRFDSIRERTLSANVYLGAGPIAAALRMGANVVITGRAADASLALAPMMHEFGWNAADWDRLAAGMAAGHILECGLQASGGNFTDWRLVPSWRNMGFPIVRMREDGSFAVTKHPGTGGLVSAHTVTEQILYEIGSPAYLTPDVTVRFDSLTLTEAGPDAVEVAGVRGEPPPEKLKASVSFRDGFRATGRFLVAGPEAAAKAELVEEMFWEAAGGQDFYQEAHSEVIGRGLLGSDGDSSGEAVLHLAVRDSNPDKIRERFSPRIAPLVLGSIPGITLLDPARPRPTEVIAHWPCLVSREAVTAQVTAGGQREATGCAVPPDTGGEPRPVNVTSSSDSDDRRPAASGDAEVRVGEMCLARSGDKGDIANVGLIARTPQVFEWLRREMTAQAVGKIFSRLTEGRVERFEFPNLSAFNFLLHAGLGGGGVRSLRVDPQGKTYAQLLLGVKVRVPREVAESVWRR